MADFTVKAPAKILTPLDISIFVNLIERISTARNTPGLGLGQQVIRRLTQENRTIHAVHDVDGNRIAEYEWDGVSATLIREYIWLGGRAVGVIEGGQLYFIRTDHIGRPVFATDSTGSMVWEASYLPFGGVHVTTGTPIALRGLRPFGAKNGPPNRYPGAPHSPASAARPKPACIRTGCATSTRPPAATSRPTRWGWWTGRVCMGMRGRARCCMWTRGAAMPEPSLAATWEARLALSVPL